MTLIRSAQIHSLDATKIITTPDRCFVTQDILDALNAGSIGGDGTPGANGKSLEFDWQGTQLGIRVEGTEDFQYVDLQGSIGPAGPKGDKGDQGLSGQDGLQGPMGPAGPKGADGAAGPAGASGRNGREIELQYKTDKCIYWRYADGQSDWIKLFDTATITATADTTKIEKDLDALAKKVDDLAQNGTGEGDTYNYITLNDVSNPLVINPLEYGYFKMSKDVTNLPADTSFPFDVVADGNLQLDGKGNVLLKAGKTYRIACSTWITHHATNVAVGLRVANAATNEMLFGGAKVPVTHPTPYSGGDVHGILTPEEDMAIGIRCFYPITKIGAGYTNLVVEEIRSNPINQYGGFETEILFEGNINATGTYELSDDICHYDYLIVTTKADTVTNNARAIAGRFDLTKNEKSILSNNIVIRDENNLNLVDGNIVSFESNKLTLEKCTNDIVKIVGIKGQIPSLLIGGEF